MRALRTARAHADEGRLPEACASYQRVLEQARRSQVASNIAVSLFEYGTSLALHNAVTEAHALFAEAEGLAVVYRLPVDVATHSFVQGLRETAAGNSKAGAQHFGDAAQRFLAEHRTGLAAGALSKYALALDGLGSGTRAIVAHTEAIRAWRELPSGSQVRQAVVARHLELRALHYCRDIGPIEALGAMREACEAWGSADSPADVARVHYRVGDLWLRLGRSDVAHGHFESAYNTYVAHGDQASADRIRAEWIARRDVPSSFGPMLA